MINNNCKSPMQNKAIKIVIKIVKTIFATCSEQFVEHFPVAV